MNNELSTIQSVKIRLIRQIRERTDLRKHQVPTYRKSLYYFHFDVFNFWGALSILGGKIYCTLFERFGKRPPCQKRKKDYID